MDLFVLKNLENDLGECPTWDAGRQRLFWTDIRQKVLYSCASDGMDLQRHKTSNWVGSFVLCKDSTLLLGNRKALTVLEIATGQETDHLEVETTLPGNRINDGRCDHQGRYWFGTMDDREDRATGSLYCCEADGTALKITRVLSDIGTPNCLSFSPDGRFLYFADSQIGDVWRYRLDPDDPKVFDRSLFFPGSAAPGAPDGATVDVDGCHWHTRYGAGQVIRVTPGGKIDMTLTSEVLNLTACAFGGRNMDTLFVSSACQHMSEAEKAAQGHAGSLFASETRFQGIEEPTFGHA